MFRVEDSTQHADIHVPPYVIGIYPVRSAWSHAKLDAAIRVAAKSVTSLVCLASKIALGLVHIVVHANCHALCPAIVFHVLNAARCFSVVGISVLLSVERHAQMTDIVKFALSKR